MKRAREDTMKWLMVCLVSLVAACAAVSTPEMKSAGQVVSLGDQTEHWCTAVVVGDHTLLTAEHCLHKPITHVKGLPSKVTIGEKDGKDHVFLHTDTRWPSVAKISMKHPELTETVYIWGHAEGGPLLFRRGYYSGYGIDPEGVKFLFYDLEIIFGDSGSPIFNTKGEVIGTVNIIHQNRLLYRMMGSQPWEFTPAQWKTIR